MPNGSAYVINDTTIIITYSGTMYHNLYYSIAYSEIPTALKILQDMAIYFDAFFAIKNNQIILISQSKCGSVKLGETIDDKMTGISEMNYDFVGYDLTFTLKYLFATYEDETTIRNLINERDVRLIPRVDFQDKYQP